MDLARGTGSTGGHSVMILESFHPDDLMPTEAFESYLGSAKLPTLNGALRAVRKLL